MSNEWMTPTEMAHLAAEELEEVLALHGITTHLVEAEEDRVSVIFLAMPDAEAFLTLGINADHVPGTLYDRVSSGCVTAQNVPDISDEDAQTVREASWRWTVHPDMHGRRVEWHVAVDIPVEDAIYVSTRLNGVRWGDLG